MDWMRLFTVSGRTLRAAHFSISTGGMWLYMSRLSTDSGSKPRESMNCLQEERCQPMNECLIPARRAPLSQYSLECFVLALNLGHDISQQLCFLLAETSPRGMNSLSTCCLPHPHCYLGRTCTGRRLRGQPSAPAWRRGLVP